MLPGETLPHGPGLEGQHCDWKFELFLQPLRPTRERGGDVERTG